jgi:hypothetical protein
MKKNLSGFFLAAAPLLLPPALHAQVFECIDARGAREFAQVCPLGTVRQRQLGRSDEAPAPAPAAESKSPALQEIEFRKRAQERQEAEAKAAEERSKKEDAERNCNQARAQLRGLQDGQRMQRVDPDTGERVVLGDEDRAADAARQQALVEQWCK